MTDRWFSELTHKYLDYVRICHITCNKSPIQQDVRNAFEHIKLNHLENNKELVENFCKLLYEARELAE